MTALRAWDPSFRSLSLELEGHGLGSRIKSWRFIV